MPLRRSPTPRYKSDAGPAEATTPYKRSLGRWSRHSRCRPLAPPPPVHQPASPSPLPPPPPPPPGAVKAQHLRVPPRQMLGRDAADPGDPLPLDLGVIHDGQQPTVLRAIQVDQAHESTARSRRDLDLPHYAPDLPPRDVFRINPL